MNDHETRWRQTLNEYTPSATDADWAALRTQLPGNEPRGGWTRRWLLGVLLVLIGAGALIKSVRVYDTAPTQTTHLPTSSLRSASPGLVSPAPPVAKLASTSVKTVPPTVEPIAVARMVPSIPGQFFRAVTSHPTREVRPPVAATSPLPVPSVTPAPASTYIAEQLDDLGKSLIVVPPPRGSRATRSNNGLYPSIRTPKH